MGQHHDGCLSSEVITVTTKGRLSLKPTNWWVKLNESSELSQATAASGVSSPPTWSTKRAKRPFSSIDVAVATLTLEIPGRHHGQRGSLPPPQKTYFHLIIPEWEVMKQGGPKSDLCLDWHLLMKTKSSTQTSLSAVNMYVRHCSEDKGVRWPQHIRSFYAKIVGMVLMLSLFLPLHIRTVFLCFRAHQVFLWLQKQLNIMV